jgi:acyl-CoA dehydrogenase
VSETLSTAAPAGQAEALAVARELAAEFAAASAAIDEAGEFPVENVRRLRGTGLLGAIVPREHGGLGLDLAGMVEVAQLFGAACTSTAMIWAMHCQQVATVLRHGDRRQREEILPGVASGDLLLASITTEAGKGGHLMSALAPLESEGDRLVLHRHAPVVTGGMHADAFLVTMRTSPDSPANDVSLAYVPRPGAEVDFRAGWQTLGMRATASIGIDLRASIGPGQLINGPGGFPPVAVATLIPVGHLAWSAVWLGAARGAFRYVVDILRNPKTRSGWVGSDLAAHNLARVRLQLDTLSAYLHTCLGEYEALNAQPSADLQRYQDPAFQVHINNLKVLASETSFRVVDDLISVTGLRYGYTRSPGNPLERTFRDLRAAPLMYANDRLLTANGQLSLLDRTVRLAGDPAGLAPTGGAFFGRRTSGAGSDEG